MPKSTKDCLPVACRAATALICLAVVATARGAEPARATWDALPDATLVAGRIPAGTEITADLVENTKLGAVMFSDERMERLADMVFKAVKALQPELTDVLADYGLEHSDLGQLFAGECGFAMIRASDDRQSTSPLLAFWANPGEELAKRLWNAMERALDDQEDEERPARLNYMTLADQAAVQLDIPIVDHDFTVEYELPDDFDELSEEEQEAARDRAIKAFQDGHVETVKYGTVLVARLGGRLIALVSGESVAEDDLRDQSDRMGDEFANLLTAHDQQREGFAARMGETAGIDMPLQRGEASVLEIVGDSAALVELARNAAPVPPAGEPDVAEKMIRMFGLDDAGPFVLRMTLGDGLLRTYAFISAPAPRSGLLRILDQQPLAIDPPAWVPTSVVSYSQMSFDFAMAYEVVKEEVGRAFPDQADRAFQTAEQQVQAMLQTDIKQLLGSLGAHHRSISLPPELVNIDEDEDGVGDLQQRTGFVWQVEDEALWRRVLQLVGTFGAGFGFEATDEQGFRGYRAKVGELEGGLVLGKGYLVLGYGRGVLETVLASLNNPPQGADALRNSDLLDEAAELMDLRPALSFELTDGDRYLRFFRDAVATLLEDRSLSAEDLADNGEPSEDYADVTPEELALRLAQVFVVTEEEAEGLMGVVATEFRVDEDGFLLHSVNQLPAP